MTTVRIKNLRAKAIIGINESERHKRQDIVINLSFDFDEKKAVRSDSIEDSCNYRTVTKKILKAAEGSRFYLLEKLASHLLDIVMEDKLILRAKVEIDKPGALRFAESVSVEVSAKR